MICLPAALDVIAYPDDAQVRDLDRQGVLSDDLRSRWPDDERFSESQTLAHQGDLSFETYACHVVAVVGSDQHLYAIGLKLFALAGGKCDEEQARLKGTNTVHILKVRL